MPINAFSVVDLFFRPLVLIFVVNSKFQLSSQKNPTTFFKRLKPSVVSFTF